LTARHRDAFREWLRIPTWQGNLLVFCLLFLMVLSYFLFQMGQARKVFLRDAEDHARLVAEVIRLHARGAVMSRDVIDEILKTFLGNTVRFVEYLDAVEPFTAEELTAFAEEAGLAGITVVRPDGSTAQGPEGWTRSEAGICSGSPRFQYESRSHLVLLSVPAGKEGGCVLAGIRTQRIENLREEIGLANVLKTLAGLEGIRYVHMESLDHDTGKLPAAVDISPGAATVSIAEGKTGPVAEVRVPLGGTMLSVGVDASPLKSLTQTFWRDLIILSAILLVAGTFLSWLLYRQQLFHVTEMQEYERKLSRQREEAALGRAAAAIAHEIRNPLNAMAMGLQRLQIEAEGLSEGHNKLIGVVLNALTRTNGIVSGLLDYARQPELKLRSVRLCRIVDDILDLYVRRLEELAVVTRKNIMTEEEVRGDPNLLGQVVDNLLRNAVEAQPGGGFVDIDVGSNENYVFLRMRNGGRVPSKDELGRILEPYFTTKTRGTGLGLAISNRIVQAHGGRIEAAISAQDTMEISVYLPRNGPPPRGEKM
jgi:two-component system sensor histidine kinase HydH